MYTTTQIIHTLSLTSILAPCIAGRSRHTSYSINRHGIANDINNNTVDGGIITDMVSLVVSN
jgi:hypothetical protein